MESSTTLSALVPLILPQTFFKLHTSNQRIYSDSPLSDGLKYKLAGPLQISTSTFLPMFQSCQMLDQQTLSQLDTQNHFKLYPACTFTLAFNSVTHSFAMEGRQWWQAWKNHAWKYYIWPTQKIFELAKNTWAINSTGMIDTIRPAQTKKLSNQGSFNPAKQSWSILGATSPPWIMSS